MDTHSCPLQAERAFASLAKSYPEVAQSGIFMGEPASAWPQKALVQSGNGADLLA